MNDNGSPLLGDPAPFFEMPVGNSSINLKDFRGKWLVIFTHPEDILPVFKTRTIKYVLCKRKIKVLAIGEGQYTAAISGRNFVKKYIMKHSLMVIDDRDGQIARVYGLEKDKKTSVEGTKGTFVIDPKGLLRIKLSFPLSKERNLYEILKLVDSLQEADRQRKVQSPPNKWRRRINIVIKPKPFPEQG
jgi:peroxiredoxin (alkyl hydroperoxide reductase subunit C)